MIRTPKNHSHGGLCQSIAHFAQVRELKTPRSPGRLANFPDVKISKRPNFLPRNFRGGLERSGRSGRLSGVSYWAGKRMCFSPYVVRIGNHVRNVLNVRDVPNPPIHHLQSFRNRKPSSL